MSTRTADTLPRSGTGSAASGSAIAAVTTTTSTTPSASTPSASTTTTATPLPSRNPIPLSAAQESQVQQMYYRRVRHICQDEIREFAACAHNKTFSAAWRCRVQRNAMNDCLIANDTQEHRDRAREEWFAKRAATRAEAEAGAGGAGAERPR